MAIIQRKSAFLRRVQAGMDQLVESAGFRRVEQRIDEWGIFTVSLAERVTP
jgi:hypothetical protein